MMRTPSKNPNGLGTRTPAVLKVFSACTSAVIQLDSDSFCPKAERLDRARVLREFWTRRPSW